MLAIITVAMHIEVAPAARSCRVRRGEERGFQGRGTWETPGYEASSVGSGRYTHLNQHLIPQLHRESMISWTTGLF